MEKPWFSLDFLIFILKNRILVTICNKILRITVKIPKNIGKRAYFRGTNNKERILSSVIILNISRLNSPK